MNAPKLGHIGGAQGAQNDPRRNQTQRKARKLHPRGILDKARRHAVTVVANGSALNFAATMALAFAGLKKLHRVDIDGGADASIESGARVFDGAQDDAKRGTLGR